MDGLNSSGRRVSLLVEGDGACDNRMYSEGSSNSVQSLLSNAPQLSRSCSFDSQVSQGPETPLTPESAHNDHRPGDAMPAFRSPISGYHTDEQHPHQDVTDDEFMKPPASFYSASSTERETTSDRRGKRYPCRLAQQYNCDKTFTTSGHASRHSKIHFAVKTIPCSYHGCQKMFTRTDNMKQHLETHYKHMSDKAGHSAANSYASGAQASTQARSPRENSTTPPFEDAGCAPGIEPSLSLRSVLNRDQTGLSIDRLSLATLANAARQVEDL